MHSGVTAFEVVQNSLSQHDLEDAVVEPEAGPVLAGQVPVDDALDMVVLTELRG